MWAWASKLFSGKKGIIEEVSDVADKWIPSDTTKHKMSIEDLQAGDASQAAAQKMVLTSHNSWFDILVDGLNRLPRPLITGWVVAMLFGWVAEPAHLQVMSPMTLNIIWTVITFWFGSRVLFKDIPSLIKSLRK
jgi:hypothetical protein